MWKWDYVSWFFAQNTYLSIENTINKDSRIQSPARTSNETLWTYCFVRKTFCCRLEITSIVRLLQLQWKNRKKDDMGCGPGVVGSLSNKGFLFSGERSSRWCIIHVDSAARLRRCWAFPALVKYFQKYAESDYCLFLSPWRHRRWIKYSPFKTEENLEIAILTELNNSKGSLRNILTKQ